MATFKQRWQEFAQAQAPQRFCWLALAFMAGIAGYYALSVEPSRPALLAGNALCAAAACVTIRRFRPWRGIFLTLALVGLGASWASIYTLWQSPVLLRHEIEPRPVSGQLVDIERVEKGLRFTLGDVAIKGLNPEETPRRIRLSIRTRPGDSTALPQIGDRLELLAGLLPPMGPATPGGFDFARYFYFRDIGAVGYGLPPWKHTHPQISGMASRFAQWRFTLTERIIAQLGPEHGPIAAGLITGEDRAISSRDFDALRASNLYHIIAISGGHMAVIAGVIFIGLRLLFLLLPRAAGQRAGAKSWAAAITLAMITLYLFVTGMPISAVRAYVMIALVLTAVILRREVDAMRSLMLAALIMLLIDPSDILEPGFELSFVATLAIVALVEATWLRPHAYEQGSRLKVIGKIMLSALLISLVAEVATAPLVLHMFNQFSAYGVLANALATPLVALIIMPTVALFFLLLPFGLESIALKLMEVGISALMWVANTIADLPGAQHFYQSPPGWGVAFFVLGLLFTCLIHGRRRWLGTLLMVAGVGSVLTVRPPDLLIGPALKQIAMQTPHGPMLLRGRRDSLVPELWANALGYKTLPTLQANSSESWRCDRFGCIAKTGPFVVAMPHTALALIEDCPQANLTLTTIRGIGCQRWLLGPDALANSGVQAFWVKENGYIRHETSAQWQGRRPWSLR